MGRMINDADTREEPLKIFQQKVSVFEKPEHAQVHTDTADQPRSSRRRRFGFANLSAQPKIHRGSGKKKRGKGWIPSPVKNVACDQKQILPRIPGMDAPVERHYDREEDNKGKRIEKHAIAYLRRQSDCEYFVGADGKQEVYW